MAQRDVILVIGMTGSGKTTAAKWLARQYPRRIIADADYQEFPAVYADTFAGLCDKLDPCAESARPFALGYTPMPAISRDDFDECDGIFEAALAVGDCALILEEADRFGWELPHHQEAVIRGRHRKLTLIYIAPSAVLIPTQARRQATRVISFRQIFPRDLDALAEIVGPTAYELGPDENGKFKLPPFTYLDWDVRGPRIMLPSGREKLLTAPRPSDINSVTPPSDANAGGRPSLGGADLSQGEQNT